MQNRSTWESAARDLATEIHLTMGHERAINALKTAKVSEVWSVSVCREAECGLLDDPAVKLMQTFYEQMSDSEVLCLDSSKLGYIRLIVDEVIHKHINTES